MMSKGMIPRSDHVARYCKASFHENGVVSAAAFMRRADEEHPSVTWLEETGAASRVEQVARARNTFGLKMAAKARIAVLNVGMAIDATSEFAEVGFEHDPRPENTAHAIIIGYQSGEIDLMIADALAEAIDKVYPAREETAHDECLRI